MAGYQLGDGGAIIRKEDGAIIPWDPDNRDYQQFLTWSKTNTLDPLPAANLYQIAADARYKAEISGIVLGQAPILTDRQSQALINGAVALVQLNPTATVRFKTAAGTFSSLNAQQVIGIGVAVAQHVQACFAREADVALEIAAGTLTTPDAVIARFADLTRT